jgi:hypothetical protein
MHFTLLYPSSAQFGIVVDPRSAAYHGSSIPPTGILLAQLLLGANAVLKGTLAKFVDLALLKLLRWRAVHASVALSREAAQRAQRLRVLRQMTTGVARLALRAALTPRPVNAGPLPVAVVAMRSRLHQWKKKK